MAVVAVSTAVLVASSADANAVVNLEVSTLAVAAGAVASLPALGVPPLCLLQPVTTNAAVTMIVRMVVLIFIVVFD